MTSIRVNRVAFDQALGKLLKAAPLPGKDIPKRRKRAKPRKATR